MQSAIFAVLFCHAVACAQTALPVFDFTTEGGRAGWTVTHEISNLTGSNEGLTFQISGSDPYLTGPLSDFPAGQPLWARLRVRSDAGGSCQLFYYSSAPSEANSVRFTVPAGQWVEARVPLPPLGSGYRMRIDPPGTAGTATLARLAFEARGALPSFDFGTLPDAGQWSAANHIASVEPTSKGLRVNISGGDPYLFGPSRDYPDNTLLWLNIRLFSEQAGTCQVFYFSNSPAEENSVRFSVPAGTWYETRVPMPALGPNYRLRIDPPGASSYCLLGRLWFEERVLYKVPSWPLSDAPGELEHGFALKSGPLNLRHAASGQGAFVLEVEDERVAIGNSAAQVGYVIANRPRWFPIQTPSRPPSFQATVSNLVIVTTSLDPDGGEWNFEQQFQAGPPGVISVETRVTVNQERQVLYLSGFTLLAGVGTWGTNKHQGLFAGIEYLDNEPSSSEADLEGPESWRLVPDTVKSTFPLMAVQHDGRYIGLIWEPVSAVAAVFDSPDRQFNSGGHLLGLLFPGSDGGNREQRSLLPYDTALLRAGSPFVFRAKIIGGQGDTVVPAVQRYVELQGLPKLPALVMSAEEYFDLAARGWLDSRIRETNLFRHAYWPGFNPQPASDAALWMLWLSQNTTVPALAQRLTNAAAEAIGRIPRGNYNASQIGHIRFPAPALVFGAVPENAAQSETQGYALLSRFQSNGTILYQSQRGGIDYGRTHWEQHANGLTAAVTLSLLEAAAFSGKQALIEAALKQVRSLFQYRNGVPRGAQTWEIPLHTPDILASAYLVRAFTLGYELSGDIRLLEEAKYWAWTGVPFVYLREPVAAPIGAYATIPVLGATTWVAPVWIGLPVQWCGLVYADALYRFAPYDPDGPWRTLADGITASGIQQAWPTEDRERLGLLPDIFHLKAQLRDGPAINPATLQIPAMRFFGQPAPYSFRMLQQHGLRIHAPGEIVEVSEKADSVSFKVRSWTPAPYQVLVNGLNQQPKLKIAGRDVPLHLPHEYLPTDGRLVISLHGEAEITLDYPSTQEAREQ